MGQMTILEDTLLDILVRLGTHFSVKDIRLEVDKDADEAASNTTEHIHLNIEISEWEQELDC